MNILVEGPDCTGKSTLIRHLQDRYNLEYLHLKRINQDVWEFYDDFCSKEYNNTVFDRGYISNIVYSTVFGDSKVLKPEQQAYFQDQVDVIIVCLPEDKSRYLKHFEKHKQIRHEDYDVMDIVYDEFREFITDSVIRFDIFRSNNDFKEIDDEIDLRCRARVS